MNCKNQTVFIGDNLPILRGLNSGIADLIATDPPFNKEKRFNHPFGTNPQDRKGKTKPGFDDAWTLDDVTKEEHELLNSQHPDLYHLCTLARKMHSAGMMAYLIMMSSRMLECHRILKETGSIYLHCDHTATAYLRMLMDGVFGKKNFRNEIIWCYEKPRPSKIRFRQNHDTILYYAKRENSTFHTLRVPTIDGKFEMRKPFKRPDGTIWTPKAPGKAASDWWIDIPSFATAMSSKERTGWATQKPIALYTRFVLASSNPGDLVIDPFCGCATTLVAAENAGRKWIGIDRDENAKVKVVEQLDKLNESTTDWLRKVIIRTDQPVRDDLGKIPHYKTHFDRLYREQSGICPGCNWHRDAHVMTVDHDWPRSKGGQDNIENLRVLCSGCNSSKGTKTMAQLIARNKKKGIWNDGLYGREKLIDETDPPHPNPKNKPPKLSKKQTSMKLK